FESELIPLQSPSIARQPIDSSIAIQTALAKRAEMDAAVRDIRVASVRLGASKNELMPRLDLIAGAYVAGLTPDRSFADAFGRQFSDGRPTYNMGLAWEQPVGSRAAKMVRYRRQLEMQEAMARYESAVQDVRRDVEIALHQIHLTYRAWIQRNHALAAAQDEAEFLLDRWNTAPGSDGPVILLLEDLISAQARLADEENATVIAETEHAIAQVRYLQATGTLIHSCRPLVPVEPFQPAEQGEQVELGAPVENLPVPIVDMPEAMIESEINAPEQSIPLQRSPAAEGGSR
ncbi:MAG: TolC family protein, partial [Planctomycetaceae bacterium]